ncbi:hypothetical protein DAI22_06g128866 [Oryza sativa Japonica Group]|nr:hypothetical protein DAI22_06g128866 [Oryza sativa Japonica Group]
MAVIIQAATRMVGVSSEMPLIRPELRAKTRRSISSAAGRGRARPSSSSLHMRSWCAAAAGLAAAAPTSSSSLVITINQRRLEIDLSVDTVHPFDQTLANGSIALHHTVHVLLPPFAATAARCARFLSQIARCFPPPPRAHTRTRALPPAALAYPPIPSASQSRAALGSPSLAHSAASRATSSCGPFQLVRILGVETAHPPPLRAGTIADY